MDIDTLVGGVVQIISFIIGIQVIARVSFSWKLRIWLSVLLSLSAIPLFIFAEYISVPYIMLVLFVVLYRTSRSIKLSITSLVVTFICSIIADALKSQTLILIKYLSGVSLDKNILISYAIFFIYVCVIFKLVDIVLNKINRDIIYQSRYMLLIIGISSLTLMLFYFYIFEGSKEGFTDTILQENAIVFLVYTIIMTATLTVVIKTAVRSAKVEAQALQMRQLQEYVGALEALQKDVRVFRHDYVNILSGINGFITNEDMDGLRVYFRTKVIPMNSDMEVNISKLATLHNLEVVELKGLFATKLIRAQELGVNAQVEVYKKIDQINMDSIDLCRAVGILLDNAIEAVMGTEDPTIRVAIIQKKDAIVLVFANNLPEDSPPVHQFFDEGFSTKGENRGLGLSTLKKTLKKYPNVSLDTKVTQLGFVQELEIG